MAPYRKRIIKPKAAFLLLVLLLSLLISILIPLTNKLAHNEVFLSSELFTATYLSWGIFGLIGGLIIAFIGIFWLKESIMIRIIRIFLILFIALIVLLYATLKMA